MALISSKVFRFGQLYGFRFEESFPFCQIESSAKLQNISKQRIGFQEKYLQKKVNTGRLMTIDMLVRLSYTKKYKTRIKAYEQE